MSDLEPVGTAPTPPLRAAICAVLAVALVTACVSPAGIQPRSQSADPASLAATRTLNDIRLSPAAWPDQQWWKKLGDAQLDELVAEALADHPTANIARARVDSAIAAANIAGARLGIANSANADVARQRASARAGGPPAVAGREVTAFRVSLDFGHDLDFWDRNRAALDAELGRVKAAEADALAARLVLSVAVARAYVQLALHFDQRDSARSVQAQRAAVLSLARERLSSGLDSAIDVKQSEAQIAEARTSIMRSEEAIALSRNQLAALLGKGPDRGLDIRAPQLLALADATLPSALPADLIGRRPDVVASRWRVEATLKDIDAARAEFYPNINLAAYVGLQSLGLDNLLRSGSHIFGIGPAVRLPLFGGTTLKANLAARDADHDLAVERYNQLLVDALREVVDQVASLQSLDAQRAETERGITATREAHELTLARYRSGLANRLSVLASETQLLERNALLADLRARRFDASINLIRALGGGFDEADVALPATATQERKAP